MFNSIHRTRIIWYTVAYLCGSSPLTTTIVEASWRKFSKETNFQRPHWIQELRINPSLPVLNQNLVHIFIDYGFSQCSFGPRSIEVICSQIITATSKGNAAEGNSIGGTACTYCASVDGHHGRLAPCSAFGDAQKDENRGDSLGGQESDNSQKQDKV